jgi:hypothetical protein
VEPKSLSLLLQLSPHLSSRFSPRLTPAAPTKPLTQCSSNAKPQPPLQTARPSNDSTIHAKEARESLHCQVIRDLSGVHLANWTTIEKQGIRVAGGLSHALSYSASPCTAPVAHHGLRHTPQSTKRAPRPRPAPSPAAKRLVRFAAIAAASSPLPLLFLAPVATASTTSLLSSVSSSDGDGDGESTTSNEKVKDSALRTALKTAREWTSNAPKKTALRTARERE